MKIDPRIAKDGVTAADLVEQAKFSLKVRDALADARAVQTRVRQAREAKRGDQEKLDKVWDRLTTRGGPYEDQMFVDQLSNVNRSIAQADQKVGASYYERAHASYWGQPAEPSRTPTALLDLAYENFIPLRHKVADSNNIVRWTSHPHGGHFAALEQPEVLAADIRAFFRA